MDIDAYWKRVFKLMKTHKISAEKFAEYIKIPRSTFYSWKRCKRSPEVGTAYNMATALGVSVEYLVTGENGKSVYVQMEQTETRKSAVSNVKKLASELQGEIGKL